MEICPAEPRRCKNELPNGEGNSMESAQAHPLGVRPADRPHPAEQKTSPQERTFTREDLRKDTYVREEKPSPESEPPAERERY